MWRFQPRDGFVFGGLERTGNVVSCQVSYRRSSSDSKGRFYALGPAGQKLPRTLRHLLFGAAFYELVRQYARQHGLGMLP